jgi:hypothetical protein
MSRRFRAYPKNPITIADGTEYQLQVAGRMINVAQANATFEIIVDNSETLIGKANKRYIFDEGDEFKSIIINNNSGGDLTFQIEAGFGNVESDDISISGTVDVGLEYTGGAPARAKVFDSGLADIEDLLNGSSTDVLQAGKTDLTNASNAQVSNSTVVLATAAANTDGVIIHIANGSSYSSSIYSALMIDGVIVSLFTNTSSFHYWEEKDLFIPSGVEVKLVSTHTSHRANAWFKIL